MRSGLKDDTAEQAYSPFSLDNQVAWVTGSTRGIGQAIAMTLARSGAHVIIHGRDESAIKSTMDAIIADGRSAHPVVADVTDEAGMIACMDEIVSRHGRLDILVNNAGMAARQPLTDIQTSDWRALFETNVTACFVLAREAGRLMAQHGRGRIINIASVAGLMAANGRASYVASKHALIGLTRSLALEFGGQGVTANAIAPGFIATQMNADLRRDETLDSWVRARNPQARWGRPEDVAHAALYLASDEAAFVNGVVLCVDGGMSAVVI